MKGLLVSSIKQRVTQLREASANESAAEETETAERAKTRHSRSEIPASHRGRWRAKCSACCLATCAVGARGASLPGSVRLAQSPTTKIRSTFDACNVGRTWIWLDRLVSRSCTPRGDQRICCRLHIRWF